MRHLLVRELRSALRERGVVMGSLLLPLLLGPFALWSLITLVALAQGGDERRILRLAPAEPASAEEILGGELADELFVGGEAGGTGGRIDWLEPPEDTEAAVLDGRLDGVIVLHSLGGADELRLMLDSSRPGSRRLRARIEEALERTRERRHAERIEQAEQRGELAADTVAMARQPFRLETRNLAPPSKVGGFLLAQVVPLLAVIMVALGCFYPAIDCTAGERERSTWETTLALAVSRRELVLAKYLHVVLLGAVAGLSSLAGLALALRSIVAPVIGGSSGIGFGLSPLTWSLAVLAVVLLAFVVAAGMLFFAGLAHGFREGQSLAGPFLLVLLLPALAVQSPETSLDYSNAWFPVASTLLILRGALSGSLEAGPLISALLFQSLLVGLLLFLARRVVERDEVWLGEHRWRRWLHRVLGRRDEFKETRP